MTIENHPQVFTSCGKFINGLFICKIINIAVLFVRKVPSHLSHTNLDFGSNE